MTTSAITEAHAIYLRRLTGVSNIPYLTSDPPEVDAVAHLWVDGLIEAVLPPITPNGWRGTATVTSVRQRGLDVLRERGLLPLR